MCVNRLLRYVCRGLSGSFGLAEHVPVVVADFTEFFFFQAMFSLSSSWLRNVERVCRRATATPVAAARGSEISCRSSNHGRKQHTLFHDLVGRRGSCCRRLVSMIDTHTHRLGILSSVIVY